MEMHAELRTREALGPLGPVEEKNAPDLLYTAGDTSLLTEGSRVAIVGSRKATPDGIKRAKAVTRCQSAFKRDPLSASKKYPSFRLQGLACAGP